MLTITFCAWCKWKVLGISFKGWGISHGICGKCVQKYFKIKKGVK